MASNKKDKNKRAYPMPGFFTWTGFRIALLTFFNALIPNFAIFAGIKTWFSNAIQSLLNSYNQSLPKPPTLVTKQAEPEPEAPKEPELEPEAQPEPEISVQPIQMPRLPEFDVEDKDEKEKSEIEEIKEIEEIEEIEEIKRKARRAGYWPSGLELKHRLDRAVNTFMPSLPTVREDEQVRYYEPEAIDDKEEAEETKIAEEEQVLKVNVDEPRSKIWTIMHAVNIDEALFNLTGKYLDEIDLRTYQALLVDVVRELDQIGTIKNSGRPVESGAYSLIDKENRLFGLFDAYFIKAKEKKGENNSFAYPRDPEEWFFGIKINKSSHPGVKQIGFDIRDEAGTLENIFSDTDREVKTHILVGHLDDGKTYLKLEERGVGTVYDTILHGVDWLRTRKQVENLMGKKDKSPPRKEHQVNPKIVDAYKKIEAELYERMPKSDEDRLGVDKSGEAETPKFIHVMLNNLKALAAYIEEKESAEAAEALISEFIKVCMDSGYSDEELHVRHGNEIVVDLETLPEFKKDIGKLTKDEDVRIKELVKIRNAILEVIDIIYPNNRGTMKTLKFDKIMSTPEMKAQIEKDIEIYGNDSSKIPALQDSPRISQFFDGFCKLVLDSEDNSREQATIYLMTEALQQNEKLLEFSVLFQLMQSLSHGTRTYFRACQMEKLTNDKDAMEGIEMMKSTADQYLDNAKALVVSLKEIEPEPVKQTLAGLEQALEGLSIQRPKAPRP